ncbi:MAG: membrane protein insertion efficiency factor YidD [Deltaproteobacteria bacterium]|nr:membrane protein insertion efficiency factor YidD [Deltaproteobacteria bacterium]
MVLPTTSDRPVARLLSLPIAAYRRWVSPLLPPACRFEPSCSQYALWVLATHRPPRALALIAWRLVRCQPLCAGGTDWPPPGPYGDAARLARIDRPLVTKGP